MGWPLDPCAYQGPLVYAIVAGGFVKIGFTSSTPAVRIEAMQTGCPDVMSLVAAMPGDMDDERDMQNRASPDHHRGEWYRLGPHAMAVVSHMQQRTPEIEGPALTDDASRLRAVWGIAQAQGRIASQHGDDRRPNAGWLGEQTASGEVRLVAATIHEELRRLGHDPSETVDRWRAAGWLMLTPSGRARTSLRIAGSAGVGAYRLTDAGVRVAQDGDP